MAKKGKMTEEEKARLPEAFRENFGRFRGLTTEEAREIGKKGGDAWAEKERRIKEAQEAMRRELQEDSLMLLDADMLEGVRSVFEKFNLPAEKGTNLMGVLMGQMKKAQSGDPTAAKFLFEVAGIFTETKNVNFTTDRSSMLLGPKPD